MKSFREMILSGVLAIYSLWAGYFVIYGAAIQAGGAFTDVNGGVLAVAGIQFGIVLIITAVYWFVEKRKTSQK